jgi:hypothetical protein
MLFFKKHPGALRFYRSLTGQRTKAAKECKYFFLRSAKKKPHWGFSARHGSTDFPAPSQRNPVWFKMGIFCHRSSTGKSLSTSLPCNPFDRLRVFWHLTEKAEIKESPGFFSCTTMPGERYVPVMALQPGKRRFSN